ncbi:hypothetical protein GA0115234_1068211 [Streptomyces sp. DvalAA-43]|nr:hypothetical protein GA0115234_1068211 [Streptomyces sp. DvalAA-43]
MDLHPDPEADPCEGNGAVKDAGTPVAWPGHRPELLTAWADRWVRCGAADAGPVDVASASTVVTPLAGQDACSTPYVGTVLTGRGCFESYGDKIWAGDDECHQVGGAGSGGYCNYDMREDGQVGFRVVTRNGATGPNDTTGAWTRWLTIG